MERGKILLRSECADLERRNNDTSPRKRAMKFGCCFFLNGFCLEQAPTWNSLSRVHTNESLRCIKEFPL